MHDWLLKEAVMRQKKIGWRAARHIGFNVSSGRISFLNE
jgi:hypothetical protein